MSSVSGADNATSQRRLQCCCRETHSQPRSSPRQTKPPASQASLACNGPLTTSGSHQFHGSTQSGQTHQACTEESAGVESG
ncbi:hypothetical protein SRHO_G00313870 [Serrasalmus rhombeus]